MGKHRCSWAPPGWRIDRDRWYVRRRHQGELAFDDCRIGFTYGKSVYVRTAQQCLDYDAGRVAAGDWPKERQMIVYVVVDLVSDECANAGAAVYLSREAAEAAEKRMIAENKDDDGYYTIIIPTEVIE